MYKSKINKRRNVDNYRYSEKSSENAYQTEFDYFFNPNDKAVDFEDRKALYVPDPEVEDAFGNIKKCSHNSINFFAGYAGSGKTTTLRYYFKVEGNHAVINEDEGILICPSFFDAHSEKIDTAQDLAARIGAVCAFLEKRNAIIRKDFYSNECIQKFYDFISDTKPEILYQNNFINFVDMPQVEQIKKCLNDAYSNFKYSYEASRLKYYILNYCPSIKKVIIILDDIESLSYEDQCNYVRDYLSFHSCMMNLPNSYRIFHTNIIISLRPHTYRILMHNKIIEAFPVAKVIKKNPIDIKSYFAKLYELKKQTTDCNELERLTICYKTIFELCNKFNGKYAKMILNLTHYNVRKMMIAFSQIMNNRTWITKNQDLHLGDSSEYYPNYLFNNITVIRALACNEYKVYYNDDECLIPNILYSTPDKDYGILCLLLLNYFMNNQHPDTLFGINSEQLQYKYIVSSIGAIFDESGLINQEDIIICLNYLYKKKILRKSIYDEDVPPNIIGTEKLKETSFLYLSSRGYELIDMFYNDSVLMEMYREDIYRYYNNNAICEPSYILMLKNRQEDIFLDLLNIVADLIAIEARYIEFTKRHHTFGLYQDAFGNESVCYKLIVGIERSIEYSNKNTDKITGVYNNILEGIRNLDFID